MPIFCTILALAAYMSLAACSDKDEKERLLEGIETRSAKIDSLLKQQTRTRRDIATLKAETDSLNKFGDLLLAKNNQLIKELKQTKQEVTKSRRENKRLQEKVGQLKVEIDRLQEDKHTSEREIHRLAVEIDSISADRNRLIGANQDLKNKLNDIKETLNEVRRIQKSVRLLVGTESLLERNSFLKTSSVKTSSVKTSSSKFLRRKQYKLVKKLADDDRVSIVSLNQQLDLTLNSVPEALVDRSGKLKLKALVDHRGKLKAGRDYTIRRNTGTAIITFINPILEGADVLAVVEVEN